MSTNDTIDHICSDITKIMVKYPDLFPIVEIILKNGDTTHARLILESYCGVKTITRLKYSAMMELWWSMPITMYQEIKKVLLKDILFEYVKKPIFPKDREDVCAMFEIEGL